MGKIKETCDLSKKIIDDVRIVGASSPKKIFTWVHYDYVIHDNTSSQTGGVMFVGYGMVNFRSSNQKINTNSSTEL